MATDTGPQLARIYCGAGLALCSVQISRTLLPGFSPQPDVVWLLPLLGVFPALFMAHRSVRGFWPGNKIPSTYLQELPPLGRVGVRIIGIVAFVHFLYFVTLDGKRGVPEKTQDGYILNSHGTITAVSYQEYLHVLAGEERTVLLLGATFYAVAGALLAIRLTRRPGFHDGMKYTDKTSRQRTWPDHDAEPGGSGDR